MTINIISKPTSKPKTRLPVITNRLGIVKQDLVTPLYRQWDVQAGSLMDNPKGTGKGHTYIVYWPWFEYAQRIMSKEAYNWWKREFMLVFNRNHRWDSSGGAIDSDWPRAENLCYPCNFLSFDKFTPTHARVVGHMNTLDTRILDPLKNNWYYEPHLFSKCTMHNLKGEVRNVGTSYHVYHPVIRGEPEQWAHRDRIEFFPNLPFTVIHKGKPTKVTGYCLRGANVWGHTEQEDIPLRMAHVPGELIHPYPEWKLYEKPVPPEVRPEWKI